MEDERGNFVRKINNVDRNAERLKALESLGYSVPSILKYTNQTLDMQYIHGLDMKNYLIHNNTKALVDWIVVTLDNFSEMVFYKNYHMTYQQKLAWLDSNTDFPFTKDELIGRLPKELPQTIYHGDLTLENILHTEDGFYMIDAVTIDYDSYIFDIAKMRQDLECKWFLRNSTVRLDTKLQNIQESLKHYYPEAFDDNLLILMLLRVYVHTKEGDFEREFILREINRLWK